MTMTCDKHAEQQLLSDECAWCKLPRWRNAKDDPPPKDGTPFLAWCPNGEVFEVGEYYVFTREVYKPAGNGLYTKDEETYGDTWSCNAFDWWMPLPEAPK